MKAHTLTDYIRAGCPEMGDVIGRGIHILMEWKVCDTGCNRFQDGRCGAYRNLTGTDKCTAPPLTVYKETVRQEAVRRGISIKQVRKQRRDKELKVVV